jgi:uncharacterized protein YcfL
VSFFLAFVAAKLVTYCSINKNLKINQQTLIMYLYRYNVQITTENQFITHYDLNEAVSKAFQNVVANE